MSEISESEFHSVKLLPSPFTNFNILPQNSDELDSLPSRFSKSVDFKLTIGDKTHFKRFVYVSIFILVFVPALILLLLFLTHKKQSDDEPPKNLTLALNQALLFFDAQKSGYLPENYSIAFRGNSGLNDGKEGNVNADLVGGYYDSGNNIKFSFSTAYTVTLLSWTVIEYHQKYADIGELDHINDLIKWGSDYLLKLFIPPNSNSNSAILYSQVGGNGNGTNQENDAKCWQKPEDMNYPRPVSVCDDTAADLAGEIVAGMSAASLVFTKDEEYSKKLVEKAEKLFSLSTRQSPTHKLGIYTENDLCGGQARDFYNSSGYIDEVVWGATWLFFASGNSSYLKYATDHFFAAEEEEMVSDKGIFYWNNKLTANAYAATASFLSKLYSDYLELLTRTSGSCSTDIFSTEMLQNFAMSQVNYILGDNPMKMSYMVGYGNHYPNHVHHRGASIPWAGEHHSCSEGNAYLKSEDRNPNNLLGAMVRGPDKNNVFLDDRAKPWLTEPSISSNAGLVAALIALHDPPISDTGAHLGIDKMGIFKSIHLTSTRP
ncbi:hypothetical protein BUALT_Bualt08G0106600 [Buddleja alternifolia]|uniref:Endoglucanase n=1 Tax=Buddleja alternifolia TaxID=168488 RepID=A0AAV6XGD5_9LAMI|nr:hypothetical protein BUALT_Bualt08G0106600 [Buddleja alternifolia]